MKLVGLDEGAGNEACDGRICHVSAGCPGNVGIEAADQAQATDEAPLTQVEIAHHSRDDCGQRTTEIIGGGRVAHRDHCQIAREWRVAAIRILGQLEAASAKAREAGDREHLAACYSQAIDLCEEFGLLPTWLVEIASHLADLGLWSVLSPITMASKAQPSAVEAFRLGLAGIRMRRQGTLKESLALLTAALEGGALQHEAADLLALHRANTVRNLGRYMEAAALYEPLAAGDGRHASRAAYWLADMAYLGGRFSEALGALDRNVQDVYLRGETLRLTGHIYRVNGLFDKAELAYLEALEHARRTEAPAMEAKALTNVAEALCWTRPGDAVDWANQALAMNEAVGNQTEVVKGHIARAIAAQGSERRTQLRSELDAARSIARHIGYRGGMLRALIAELFHSVLSGEAASAAKLRTRAKELAGQLGGNGYWLDVVDAWIGTQGESGADWLDGVEATQQRWAAVLDLRRI